MNKFLAILDATLRDWQVVEQFRLPSQLSRFVVEGIRGGTWMGEPFGDICIDDFLVSDCGNPPATGISTLF